MHPLRVARHLLHPLRFLPDRHPLWHFSYRLTGASGGRSRVGRPVRHAAACRRRCCRRCSPSSPCPPACLQAAAEAQQAQESGADVYAFEPQPLEEGVRKHMLSVFVADESGLINRVAGVFARRGANIESLAVGLTIDKVRG